MTKKKILVLALTIAMVAILAVGGSLAYLTDTKTATNTFTVGNVQIDLIEQEKLAGEETLKPYKDGDKVLKPGKSNDGNAVSKIVTVENTGANDAWVWVELKIPTVLVSNEYKAEPHTNESKNALHWNSYGCFNVEYNAGNYWGLAISDGIVGADHKVTNADMVAVNDGLWHDYEFVSKDENYVTIRTKMKNKLPAGKISLPCLAQVYMDWRVKTDESGNYILPDGTTAPANTTWEIIVNAYAIQADGIDSVDKAIEAYANNGN